MSNHNKLCRDGHFGNLQIGARTIVDKEANLDVNAAKVRGDLLAKGNVVVQGKLQADEISFQDNLFTTANGKMELGDTLVTGTMFCAQDEFTESVCLMDPAANVWIQLREGLQPGTVMLTQNSCTGNILTIDEMTGNVLYQPATDLAAGRVDMYRYTAADACGVLHKVTQLVCQPTSTPPFANASGMNSTTIGGGSLGFPEPPLPPVSLETAFGIVAGTNPIDWSTFEFVDISTYTAPYSSLTGPTSAYPTFPYGTNASPSLLGPGVTVGPGSVRLDGTGAYSGFAYTVTMSVDSSGFFTISYSASPAPFTWPSAPNYNWATAVRFRFRVQDTAGLWSNIGAHYYVRDGLGQPP